MSRRFPFLPPSCGDRLLKRATSVKLELHRYRLNEPPLDALDDELAAVAGGERCANHVELSFEVRGEVPLRSAEAGELVAGLLHEFRQPQTRGKGGAQ